MGPFCVKPAAQRETLKIICTYAKSAVLEHYEYLKSHPVYDWQKGTATISVKLAGAFWGLLLCISTSFGADNAKHFKWVNSSY